MNNISHLIDTFSTEQQQNFKQFLQRNSRRSDRKDVALFEMYKSKNSLKTKEILDQLYGDQSSKSKNAYHSLRKRLFADLSDYIYLKRVELDNSKSTEVNKLLTLAGHLKEHDLDKMAWNNLLKAEKIAIKSDLNQRLVNIYDSMIQHFSPKYAPYTIAGIIKKRIEANSLYQEEETLQMIYSIIKQELDAIRLEGKDINLQQLADRLIDRFGLSGALFKRPKLLYNFVFLTRSIMLGKKDYQSFEGFLINSYKKIARAEYFEKSINDHLQMLYAIAHTLYRNKKFLESIQYLSRMKTILDKSPQGSYQQFYPKYLLLLAASENFKGNLENSIEVLDKLLKLDSVKSPDRLNALLNLSVYYFEAERYKEANQVLLNLGHTDKWLEKNMGIEWRLKKNMIEAIYQYELGNPDIAFERLKAIERTFVDLLKTPKYTKVSTFISLLKKVINEPSIAETGQFYNKVENSFEWVGIEKEDLQEMSYYGWLKSKMQGKKFYPVLLELIRSDE